MREFRRLLLLAAALTVTVAAGQATAQTVVVTKAPPGAAVELGLNAATIGTATADAAGIATLKVDLESRGRKPNADVRIFVDVCEKARRVTLVETGWEAPPPAAGCTRHEIFGVFYLQKITTLVVSAAEEAQAVWLKQGPAPDAWLRDVPVETEKKTGSDDAGPEGLPALRRCRPVEVRKRLHGVVRHAVDRARATTPRSRSGSAATTGSGPTWPSLAAT